MTALDAALALALPECLGGCGAPMRRDAWRAHHGRCASCRPADTPPMASARQQLADWQNTVARIHGDRRRQANDRADRLAARRRNRKDKSSHDHQP